MGCEKDVLCLCHFLPFKMHYPALTMRITSEKSQEKEMLQNMLKTSKLKKKARKVWEAVTPKMTKGHIRSKHNVIFWNKRKGISES